MHKHLWSAAIATVAGLIATATHAAPGEYWEITTKMEMAGMPFQMPATTVKVCVPSGGEKNPQHMQQKDKSCQMTDVRTSGNKVTWKATCVHDGETMTGNGESIHEQNGYRGSMHMNGKSHGQTIDMTQTYNGKRIGGSCDSEAMLKEITGKVCDTSQLGSGADWVGRADMFLKGNTCPGKKEAMCSVMRRDAVRDASTYQMLVNAEKTNGGLISSACGIRMAEARIAVCKANQDGEFGFLQAHCPTEAKQYREQARRRNCEGRGYTARGQVDACIGGAGAAASDSDEMPAHESSARLNRKKARAYADKPDRDEAQENAGTAGDSGSTASDAMMESAKKLKGLFGF